MRILPLEFFHYDKSKDDGRYTICKKCRREKKKLNEPDGFRYCRICGELKREYEFYPAHGNVKRRTCKNCCEKIWNKSYRNKSGRLGNGGSLLTLLGKSAQKALLRGNKNFSDLEKRNRKRYEEKESSKTIRKNWRIENREYLLVYDKNRRSKMAGLGFGFTLCDWKKTKDEFNNTCAYCGIYTEHLHQDHFIPLSKGGGYVIGNIVPSCKRCNSSKHNRMPIEFCGKEKYYEILLILERLKNEIKSV